jgi:hypothetical protein
MPVLKAPGLYEFENCDHEESTVAAGVRSFLAGTTPLIAALHSAGLKTMCVVCFLTGFVLFTCLLCDRFITHNAVMISRRNSSVLPLTFFSLLLAISLTWLQAAAAAGKAISIPVQITHAENFDPFPSPDGKKLFDLTIRDQ